MYKIAVFVTGRGSNLRALINSISADMKNVGVCAVVSSKPGCGAIEYSKEKNIPFYFISSTEKEGFIDYKELKKLFIEQDVNLIVLAGFLKKIPEDFIEAFENRIINIHPALLPSFGGKGMFGMNVHKAVFEKSAQISGPTVHFVDKVYDNGKIIAQRTVDISKVETPEQIAELVLKEEHKLLPFVVKKFSENKIEIKNNRVYIN
ncbi:MAG: phosphoribosylglycinamide formyltransferase [Melioribacteraceae bacterium]|nr:phosphoribosylglycinamide formyltransferase [Melioribacteraceae bacterium]